MKLLYSLSNSLSVNHSFIYIMNLPREIIDEILSFNADHREPYSKCMDDIHTIASVYKARYICNTFDSSNTYVGRSFIDHIVSIFESRDERISIIKGLSQCECCVRHQEDRPFTLVINRSTPHIDNCNCICRHVSRFICDTCDVQYD
jgi:hypothetical protein